MNHSEFWKVVDEAFGAAYGQALTKSLALPELGHRTAVELLDDGEAPQKVWTAICHEMDLDEETQYLHRRQPKRT
ncbi:MAG: DUF3046 domain-containing protein [Flaviflexus sp.]|uniref:DUF3046 domain-containing protein n=1 Tax=Flaviflexus sp. TaxID=1969482 RepID=UPI00352C9431